ncbi:glutathione S-transferase family protein [Sphingorhabdus arenilitoris]|uniref:Glutathione S-transferase family protein n=1 Tax=Sphingorhabdus arenilitoris TaxID=1490041 RepID=A0ABV8RE05_9SPHN
MKIFGAPLSPFVRKVMIYCAERDIPYDHVPIFPMGPDGQNPEFLAASPLGKIPAIEDDGFTLADSSAIIHYLEAKHGQALLPEDAQARGQAIFFDEIADTAIAAVTGPIFFNRVVAPKFMGREGDMAAADVAEKETLPPILAKLEKLMPDDSAYLVGGALSVADISLASVFINFKHGGVTVDSDHYPKLSAWLLAIWDRPSFQRQMALEARILG